MTALAPLLELTADAAMTTELPGGHVEAHRLFDLAGGTQQALEDLQESIARHCFGSPGRLGVCGECGKVIDRSSGHDPSGCMSIIAEPVVALVRMPKRLWLRARYHLRRQGGA